MPTDQPSSAPDDLAPRDETSVGTVLSDDATDQPPGGGGLRGPAAGGQGAAPAGTAPNAPIDVAVPAGASDDGTAPSADAQARREAVDAAATDQHPSSR